MDAVPSAKQVYIAFIQDAERAGIAYYDTSEGALCATSVSCPLIDLPWVCQVLKQQVSNPSLIITSSSVNTAVRDELAKPCDMGDAEGAAKPINVHIMKHTVCECDVHTSVAAPSRVTLPYISPAATPIALVMRVLLGCTADGPVPLCSLAGCGVQSAQQRSSPKADGAPGDGNKRGHRLLLSIRSSGKCSAVVTACNSRRRDRCRCWRRRARRCQWPPLIRSSVCSICRGSHRQR